MELHTLEEKLNYSFRDRSLLTTALTHSSYRREHPGCGHDNERLEFIGDGILDAVIALKLFRMEPDKPEGTLTKTRALVVCEKSLATVGRSIGLNRHLLLGTGEEKTGGREKDSIIADAMEAVMGAVLIDGGYETCERVILELLSDTIDEAISGALITDHKSEFQELVQKKGCVNDIRYVTDRSEGPDHHKLFFVHVEVDGKIMGSGSGYSKKEAGQNAAKEAIANLKR